MPVSATITHIVLKKKDVGLYRMASLGLTSSHSLERYGTKCITAFQKSIKHSANEELSLRNVPSRIYSLDMKS